jgi:toxin ParE1/3/4
MPARKRRIVLSAKARIDLSDVLLYTERQWGKTQRHEYSHRLSEAFNKLARFPFAGRFRPDLGPEFHSIQVRRHVIIYEVTGTEVHVERILHIRRDADAEFAEPAE